ncbi:MAG TPA: phosphatase PAP2 family protein [Anaeromyxobacteraceae bacterium]|jgi:undecaprenyl-diphosphatase|nr:phosphatase PAP2 family protein [Anaeromyxobacteraceae bacterium]
MERTTALQSPEDLLAGGAAALPLPPSRLSRLLSLDETLLLGVRRFHGPWRTRLARFLTAVGDARSWTFLGLSLLATMQPRGIHLGLRLAAGSSIAALFAQGLKRTLNRARPSSAIEQFEALADNPDAFSFPSGHTAAAFGVAVAFAGEPFGASPIALTLAVGIGLSRVYLGAHYPLDVVAGSVLGAAAGVLARLLVA